MKILRFLGLTTILFFSMSLYVVLDYNKKVKHYDEKMNERIEYSAEEKVEKLGEEIAQYKEQKRIFLKDLDNGSKEYSRIDTEYTQVIAYLMAEKKAFQALLGDTGAYPIAALFFENRIAYLSSLDKKYENRIDQAIKEGNEMDEQWYKMWRGGLKRDITEYKSYLKRVREIHG